MTTISQKICIFLNLSYHEFDLENMKLTEDAVNAFFHGGSEKGRNTGITGGATVTGRVFITNGVIEKIVEPNTILPDGFYHGRSCTPNPRKPIMIDGIQYESNKSAAEALGVSPGMITYLRKRQDKGIHSRRKLNWKFKVGA